MKQSESRWTITDVNFWLDCVLLVAFVILLGLTLVIRFVFPTVTGSERWVLWNLTFDDWIQLQFYALAIFTILVLLHVMLHWNWVCNVYVQRVRKRKKERPNDGVQTIIGVGVLVGIVNILGIFVALASMSIRQ